MIRYDRFDTAAGQFNRDLVKDVVEGIGFTEVQVNQ